MLRSGRVGDDRDLRDLSEAGDGSGQPAGSDDSDHNRPTRFGIVGEICSDIGSKFQGAYAWLTKPLNEYKEYKQEAAASYVEDGDGMDEAWYYGRQLARYSLAFTTILLKKTIQAAFFITVSPFLLYVLLPLKSNDRGLRLFLSFALGPLTLLASPFIASGLALIAMIPFIGPAMAILMGIQFAIFTGSNVMNAAGLPSWFGQTAINFLSNSLSWLRNNPVTAFFSSLTNWETPWSQSSGWATNLIKVGLVALPFLAGKLAKTLGFEKISGKIQTILSSVVGIFSWSSHPASWLVTDSILVNDGFWSTIGNYLYSGLRTAVFYMGIDKLNDHFQWIKHKKPLKRVSTSPEDTDNDDDRSGDELKASASSSGVRTDIEASSLSSPRPLTAPPSRSTSAGDLNASSSSRPLSLEMNAGAPTERKEKKSTSASLTLPSATARMGTKLGLQPSRPTEKTLYPVYEVQNGSARAKFQGNLPLSSDVKTAQQEAARKGLNLVPEEDGTFSLWPIDLQMYSHPTGNPTATLPASSSTGNSRLSLMMRPSSNAET